MTLAQINRLSVGKLTTSHREDARRERATTLVVLLKLLVVERKKIHLKLGYSSLFAYCTKYLGYSDSTAGRYIHTARSIGRCPELEALLRRREVTLGTLLSVAGVLNKRNQTELIERIRGKSYREVESIAAEYGPPARLRDRVKPVRVSVPVAKVSRACEKSNHSQMGVMKLFTKSGDSVPRTRTEHKLQIQFLASEAFMKKYEEARALMSNRLGLATFESVFEAALDENIERHSPKRKEQRRQKRRENPTKTEKKPRATTKSPNDREPSRRIPSAVRDRVYVRDGGQCTYEGVNGERCGSTHGLHIDHIKPFARGGTNAASNLRLLCANHNRLEAERIYGADHVRQYHSRARQRQRVSVG